MPSWATGDEPTESNNRLYHMKYSNNGHPTPSSPRRGSRDSEPGRDGHGIGRDDPSKPTDLPLGGTTAADEATDYRLFALILLFSLLAFAWQVLMRDVRVGLPGNLGATRHEAGATTPTGGAARAPGESAPGRRLPAGSTAAPAPPTR